MSDEPTRDGSVHAFRDFVARVWRKFDRDDASFISAAIAWGVLFALVPLLTLGVGLTGFVLSARFDDATDAVVTLFATVLPEGGEGVDLADLLQTLVGEVMASRAGLTLLGSVVFIWLATRLSGSLRSSLCVVFELGTRRGLVAGTAVDVLAVLIGVVLVTVNMGVTVMFAAAIDFGVDIFGWGGRTLSFAERFLGLSVAFASIWVLFVIVYRYLPARRTAWKTTFVAATFAGVAHEVLKFGFSWYLTELARYTSTLGNLATVAVLFFWIYYGSLVFIVGGEVAHVYAQVEADPTELSRVGEAA